MPLQQTLERMRSALTNDKFIFSEEDATYDVGYTDGKAVSRKSSIEFWARRDLGDNYPAHFAITMEGTMQEEESGTVINIEIIEYHNTRKHKYAGTKSIDEYFDKFCTFFER